MHYYDILEVSQNASPEVIKAAYKSLMQRYHPDRNPDNSKIAEHASRVVQAYEVLSDSDTRAAYDIKLKQQLTEHLDSIRNKSWDVQASPALVVEDRKSYWFVWLLITLTISSGWLILSLSKQKQSPESELKEIRLSFEANQLTPKQKQTSFQRIDEIFREHPELLKKEENEKSREVTTRSTPIFITDLTVTLKAPETSPGDAAISSVDSGKSSGDSVHVLYIPKLGAIVGAFDSDKVIRYIDSNRDLITRKLAEKLAYAKYENLLKIDGEHYLKEIILDSISDTAGTNRHEDFPSSSAEKPVRYGVVEILLPESFSVR